LESHFAKFLVGRFWGMFWKNVQAIFLPFSERWFESGKSRFDEFLHGRFWGMF
jgi:hypothetical protein